MIEEKGDEDKEELLLLLDEFKEILSDEQRFLCDEGRRCLQKGRRALRHLAVKGEKSDETGFKMRTSVLDRGQGLCGGPERLCGGF